MIQKLRANEDYYPTKESKIAYTTSRLGGNTSLHTINRRIIGYLDPYNTSKEIYDQLGDIYQDSDRKGKAQRQYHALEQPNDKSFIAFYSEFIRLGAILRKTSDDLFNDLPRKLLRRLQKPYEEAIGINDLRTAKEYLLKLDNKQRSNFQEKPSSRSSPIPRSPRKSTTNSRSVLIPPPTYSPL